MRLFIFRCLVPIFFVLSGTPVVAFCGFYVSRDDGQLFNEASKVVFTRHNNRSVITMSSDYRGPANEFAMIVPTPTVLSRSQVKTVKPQTLDHLDGYTAPRLVEYFDYDPCGMQPVMEAPVIIEETSSCILCGNSPDERRRGAKALGVTIRAEYSVGIYDIVMLSAKQSDGLITFLRQDGYNIPDGAEGVLQSYITNGMKFFVAKVNLGRHEAKDTKELAPLQIRFNSKKFMLPIQLGKINSAGSQDVLLYTLTKNGRVDLNNYDVTEIPTGNAVPLFVESFFPQFYKAMFDKIAPKSGAALEYAWDMAWCDPCAADPLSKEELRELGVNWFKLLGNSNPAQDVFVTRLHLRYNKDTFLQDLELTETEDSSNFQGRYVMNHPFDGEITCAEGQQYIKDTRQRLKDEAIELSKLTGWRMQEINGNIRKSVSSKYH